MSGPPPPRRARIVLVDAHGGVLGALPAVPVATPWWQDVEPVVRAVRERFGVTVTVLRMLSVAAPDAAGLEVAYLAETDAAVDGAEPWTGVLDEQPLRMRYAKPGGPAADLAWAQSVLASRGLRSVAAPVQVRTWNLSSLWRIPVEGQTVWLKVVPPFFAHEGALIEALAGAAVPTLLGHDGARMLMAETPGEDLYGASGQTLLRMVEILVALQRDWVGRTGELLPLGVPDWRGPASIPAIEAVIARTADQQTQGDRAALERFAAALPARFTALEACGVPDTLVHGDFHPGNWRGSPDALALLDWGDGGIGCPLLDRSAFLSPIPPESAEAVRAHWDAAWRAAVPGCDPARAANLIAPIDAARRAVIYQSFLDRIEPSEHPYHHADPLDWLQRTAALIRAEH